ncbi:ABC transporter permease [Bordetella sp. BOR01]|uniref:ABC transporter permease n=1 Tax=Bordetella sp. BOR01 TaxID=2854779 RepID=UPI001C457DDA|nr:ABC transporter permease [Bordetella sp. BOR01]MBV7483156.1 ABC transporter permease [Bordetella sp. BOR01]
MHIEYFLKRVLYIVLILVFVSALIFFLTQVLPGNAAQMILGEHATPEQVAALSARMHLDRPAYVQYADWALGILKGDWGTSFSIGQPVLGLALTALGRSALLGIVALVLVTLVAIPLGVIAAARRAGPIDVGVSVTSYIGVALPEFVTATLLLVLFARPELGLFPAGGYKAISEGGFWAFASHLILPAITLTIVMTAHISRQTRSEMVEVLESDYVRTARLKGLSNRAVLWRHALPNSLLPTITIIALDVGYLIGGILVVEEVFAYPGIGRLMVLAIQNRDLPLIQCIALLMSAIYAFANLAADLSYAWLDKRIQYE